MNRLASNIAIFKYELRHGQRCAAGLARHHGLAQRRYATGLPTVKEDHEATDIAILGGGITGLTSAYFLSKSLPNAKITLLEGSPRLGGWLHSKQVDVGNGNVVFEQGPRNIRPSAPNGLITLDLVRRLLKSPTYMGLQGIY